MLSRPVFGPEIYHVSNRSNEMIQLSIKVSKPKLVDKIVSNFVNSVPALYIKTENHIFSPTNKEPIINHLPSSISSCYESCQYVYEHQKFPLSRALGSIAYNDKIVTINMNHSVSDGGFTKFLFHHCLDDDIGKRPLLTTYVNDTFSKQLQTLPQIQIHPSSLLTTFYYKKAPKTVPTDDACYVEAIIPATEFQCFDGKKCVGLTENLWSSLILAHSAYQGSFDKAGCLTCYDLRNLLPKPRSKDSELKAPFCFTGFVIADKSATPKTTLSQLMKNLRRDFQDSVQRGVPLQTLRGFEWAGNATNSAAAFLTNVGPVRYQEPIEDFWMQQRMPRFETTNTLCTLSFSKIGYGRNDVVIRMRYNPGVIEKKEVQKVFNMALAVVKEADPRMTIEEIIQLIKNK